MQAFNELDPRVQRRLRRIYHVTSIATALRVVSSGHIWSKDPLGFANFSINRNPPESVLAVKSPDISFTFEYTGPVILVPVEYDPSNYAQNSLYVHVRRLPSKAHPTSIQVAVARLAAGSHGDLQCVGFVPSIPFTERALKDIKLAVMEDRLASALENPIPISVPRSTDERVQVVTNHPAPRLSLLELTAAKIAQFKHWQFG